MGRWGEKDYLELQVNSSHVIADFNAVKGVKRYPNGSCRAEHEVSR